MGFQYVFVPANVGDTMEELEYPEDVKDLSKDTFRTFVEQYFSKKGEAVDKAVLMAQLQERTGVNLKEKSDLRLWYCISQPHCKIHRNRVA